MEVLNKLRQLDAYPKINEDFYSRTLSGGVITIVSSVVMVLLFFTELRLFLHPVTESELIVDTSRGETLQINFDVTFPALACSILSLDAMDISGEQHLDVKHDIIKKRLDPSGKVIETRPDGIGAPKSDDDCCNTCEEVREAYRVKGWGLTNPDLIDQVNFTEQRMSFLHFITNVCAIIGGIFTVSGILDSFVYHGQRAIKKKIEIGKLG